MNHEKTWYVEPYGMCPEGGVTGDVLARHMTLQSFRPEESCISGCRDGGVFVREYAEMRTPIDLWPNTEVCLLEYAQRR